MVFDLYLPGAVEGWWSEAEAGAHTCTRGAHTFIFSTQWKFVVSLLMNLVALKGAVLSNK